MAEVVLPKIISGKMVLQRGVEVPIRGRADQSEDVTESFAGQTRKAVPNTIGKLMVKLDRMRASFESRTMTIKGKNEIKLDDVLLGEVWLTEKAARVPNELFQIIF